MGDLSNYYGADAGELPAEEDSPDDSWVSENGRVTPIEKLDDRHLLNIIHLLQRSKNTDHKQYPRLIEESQKRQMDLVAWCVTCQRPHDSGKTFCEVLRCVWCEVPHPSPVNEEHRKKMLCGPNNWQPGMAIRRLDKGLVCLIESCVPVGKKSADVKLVCEAFSNPADAALIYAARSVVTCLHCASNSKRNPRTRRGRH